MNFKALSIGIISAAVMAITMCGTAHAGLIGTTINGDLDIGINLFDPSNGFVPSGYENTAGPTVAISSTATEFGFQDGNDILATADFTDTGFTLTEHTTGIRGLTYIFVDTAFTGLSLKEISDSFSGDAVSLTGDVLTINTPSVDAGLFSLSYDFVSDVPEPSSLAMLGTSVLSLAFFGWRRRNRRTIFHVGIAIKTRGKEGKII